MPEVAQVFKTHFPKRSAKEDPNLNTILIWMLKGSDLVSASLIQMKQHQFCLFLLS